MADAAAAAAAAAGVSTGTADRDPAFRVRVLIDETRGTRGTVSSCSLLQPLLPSQHGNGHAANSCDVKISLYHTPKVRFYPFFGLFIFEKMCVFSLVFPFSAQQLVRRKNRPSYLATRARTTELCRGISVGVGGYDPALVVSLGSQCRPPTPQAPPLNFYYYF